MYLFNKKNEKVFSILKLSKQVIALSFNMPNFYGIFFFDQADGQAIVDQQTLAIQDRYLLFYYPFQKLRLEGEFEGTFIQFHPDFFCIDIHAKDIGCQGLLFNNFFNDNLIKCSEEAFQHLSAFHLNVKKELQQKQIGQLDMVSSQLKIFLIQAVRLKMGQQEQSWSLKDHWHHQIEQLIAQFFFKEASPEFYAITLGISLTQFNRLCQKYFQNNFITLLNLKRIAVAKNRLFLTDTPIKDIAYEVGYNDPLYFSRVFKKYCGVTPTAFRQQLKNNRLV